MAIYRLLQNSPFNPEEVAAMTKAYEQALGALGITNRSAPITEQIAFRIIAVAQTGERNPDALCERAVDELCSRALS